MSEPAILDESAYRLRAKAELEAWLGRTSMGPSPLGLAARGLQKRINRLVPEKVQAAVTSVIEQMTRAIVTGSDLTTGKPLLGATLSERERRVRGQIAAYRTVGATEGGVAGAGGFWLNMAEFPVLIATKIRLLFEIAALYGYDGAKLDERLYILRIFELAFSSPEHRIDILAGMRGWDVHAADRPRSPDEIDWRKFQQEYRDYIDLAKLAQLIPVIGAPIGAVVNYRLLGRLGETAVGAYRMRVFER
ncbi:MAG TPA: EcsC family protein [Caulobacteraceae bacterium]|nr:EcsC family protein [Caulobacteraceae bacterium]